MKYISFLAIFIVVISCNNSRRGSGNIISETRTVQSFTAVNANTSIEVDVKQGTEISVVVEADDNLMKYVETVVEGNELKIRLKNVSIWDHSTIKVHVTSPKYTGFEATSSAVIIGETTITSTDKISLKANSSAKIEMQIEAPIVEADASSSADIIVSGRTKDVKADASSSGTINIEKLQAENASAEASSSADISLFASIKINAKANSSGDITYTGGATDVNKSESSSGTVSKK
jgi:Putative auto-transporter adhesin, head GIN domain